MTGGHEGLPRILGVRAVPGTIHRRLVERGSRLERKRRWRALEQQSGSCCPGIKLIPACVAHQWLQTNRQSDFMLWPVSRWQPTGRHGNAAGSFGVSNSQTYGRVRVRTKAPRLRYSIERRVNSLPLSTRGGRRSKGERETGEKGAFEIRGWERGERYMWVDKGRAGGSLEVERVANVRGGGKKRRASCYTPRVFLHKSPWRPFGVRYSNGLGEHRATGRCSSLPRLSGTPALTIILLKERGTSLSERDFCRFCCTDNNWFLVLVISRLYSVYSL